MKLLFDQNLSPFLVNEISKFFPGSVHVGKIGLDRALDKEAWEYAKEDDFIIVTKDVDFSEISVLSGFPPKIIWIRRGNCTTTEIKNILVSNVDAIKIFVNDPNSGVLMLF